MEKLTPLNAICTYAILNNNTVRRIYALVTLRKKLIFPHFSYFLWVILKHFPCSQREKHLWEFGKTHNTVQYSI